MYRYLGNKTKLAAWIVDVARTVARPPARVADPMCGTASVAWAFAQAGYDVTVADELRFPVLHAKARLLCKRRPAFRGAPGGSYDGVLRALNGLPGQEGLFHREYSDGGTPRNGCPPRRYFTAHNAARIDAIRARIRDWRAEGALTGREADLLLHDLVLAVNRVANIAGTYGYFRSSWNRSSLEPLTLAPTVFVPTPGRHAVLQGRVEDLAARLDVDLCYLDPPYTKRQYAGQYHIPETIAREDEPEPVGQGGLRDWYPQSSAFCSKRTVAEAFREVLKRVGAAHVLISYSEDGLLAPDAALELFSEFGRVTRHELDIKRFRSNGGKEGSVTEHLYHVELA
ncbi:MAG TPA: DNA adenine methylase [Egibacteraceae bacterium]|nr:DNA adenine methylase [Egibacteraceae bacterium]